MIQTQDELAMTPHQTPTPLASPAPAPVDGAIDATIPQLVAEVFEAAPAAERSHLLEQLLRPLGVLSLVAIADGIFAKIRFRSGWQDLNVRLEDVQNVQAAQVMALVDHAQQVSVETVDGLAQWISASPVLSGSAAAALLLTMLVQRARTRTTGPNETGSKATLAG
jgi:hypothetical protein